MGRMKNDIMARSLGICTIYNNIESLNYEKRKLVEEAQKVYDTVILINTRRVTYQFIREKSKPILLHNGEDISNLSSLQVRTTARRETSTSLLVHSLKLCGCDVFDPVDRFSVGYASKLLSTLSRFEKKISSNSFFAFEYENALELLKELEKESMFPLIVKPIKGKQGKGVQILHDFDSASVYAANFFSSIYYTEDEPLFLQVCENFVEEFRVMVVDGTVLGIVKKLPPEGSITANAAQGAKFIKVENAELVEFLLPHIKTQGVLGIDIAVDEYGEFHILETNWAPSWANFEAATGINVAEFIIKKSIERLRK
jgi:glutathione synthase/RimK-type ligase-like ATP-grasp enzyme